MSKKMDVQKSLGRVVRFAKKALSKPAELPILAPELDKWARFERRVKEEQTRIRWEILTIVGSYALIFLVATGYRYFHISFPLTPKGVFLYEDFLNILILTALTFILLIGYPLVFSHFLPQKRPISPLGMTAIAIVATGVIFLLLSPQKLLTLVAGMVLLVAVASGAEYITKRIIGLSDMGSHQLTFVANASIKQLFAKFTIDVRDTFSLMRGQWSHNERLFMFKNKEKTYRFYIALAADPVRAKKASLIHFESYNLGEYAIGTSADSERRFKRDVDYFKKIICEERPRYKLRETQFVHAFPFREQVRRIIHEPAEGKITVLPRIPMPTFVFVIGAIILAFAFFFYSSQPQNAGLAAFVGILLVLLPVVPYLKGPAPERKWEET